MAAPVVLVIAFPRELLTVWLGATFAAHGADAVRILAAGILVNGLAHLPYVYLLGQGRPDVPAKFHLLELPLYFLSARWLVGTFGVSGAALAWTLRVTVDAALLFAAVWRLGHASLPRLLGRRGVRAAVAVAGLAALVIGVGASLGPRVAPRIALAAGTACVFVLYVWLAVLDDVERAVLRRSVTRLARGASL